MFMKNLLFKGMHLVAFCSFVASCTQDEAIEVTTRKMKEVTLTTHLVATSRTTATQEEMELFYTVYNSTTGAVIEKNATNLQKLPSDGKTSVSFTLQLDQEFSYDIAFWLQPKGLECYDISDLKGVKINYDKYLGNNSYRNVYYGNVSNLHASQEKEVTVSLKSPFGKIEVFTTTEDVKVAASLGYDFSNMKSCITVKGVAVVFNALYGVAEGDKTIISLQSNDISGDIQQINDSTYIMLASDYIWGYHNQPVEVVVDLSSTDGQQETLNFLAGKAWVEPETTFILYDRYLTLPVDFDITIDGSIDSNITL